MQIEPSKILYKDFAAWADERLQMQVAEACGVGNLGDLWQLTIADLGVISHGGIPESLCELFVYEGRRARWWNRRRMISVKTYFARYNALKSFVGTFIQLMSDYAAKETKESRQAAHGLPQFNETEGLLVFAREYFALKSFSDAEKVTLADVFLAKKDTFIKTEFERIYNEIIINKNKVKK